MAVHPERKCKDDITCMVLYLRHPRVLRVITGPPFRKETDREYANMAVFPEGKVVPAEVVGIEFDPPYTSNNMISNYRYTEDVSGF